MWGIRADQSVRKTGVQEAFATRVARSAFSLCTDEGGTNPASTSTLNDAHSNGPARNIPDVRRVRRVLVCRLLGVSRARASAPLARR